MDKSAKPVPLTLPTGETVSLHCVAGMDAHDKSEAIEQLVQLVAPSLAGIPPGRLTQLVMEREALSSTSVGDGIAFPHAVTPEASSNIVCVAVAQGSVVWDPPDKSVRVIVLFVGTPASHLPVMAYVARALRIADLLDALQTATAADAVCAALSRAFGPTPPTKETQDQLWNRRMVEQAIAVAADSPRTGLAIVGTTFTTGRELSSYLADDQSWFLLFPVGRAIIGGQALRTPEPQNRRYPARVEW